MVNVGSHFLEKAENGFISHRELNIEVEIPTSCCILFFHNRTLHAGGSSDVLNVRQFGLYGPENKFGCTLNKNYSSFFFECKRWPRE